MITKILIANRGEIAVRIIRTARQLGYRTVAVFSEADANARHVREADQSVCIGAANAGESYLVAEKILAAAEKSAADAIHPGYGFLSENADFARACGAAGIVFIGPDADAIELMGSKRLSKIAMIEAGVPCIPGYQGRDQNDEVLIAKAAEIGFPLMVKASAGGGGRGMRLVFAASELAEQIKTARSEAQNAFGSGELILERAVIEPRHIEIQVFADTQGNVVYLGERDCSIQRRHQKVVEEAPSPFVDAALRQRMGQAAVNAAISCQYVGAGTVEFLVDKDKNFYFLEMNTRLQVEHPVTELITGQDLVAWQLSVAAGEPLPLQQDEITLTGHAMEVRLYAEDPRHDFLPQTGAINVWSLPGNSGIDDGSRVQQENLREGVRVDHGIQQGQVVSPHYDPMLAKVIAYGSTRSVAARRLASAVQDTKLLGVNTNKQFLHNVLRHDLFLAGGATTAFIEQHFTADPSMDQKFPGAETLARAAVLYFKTLQPCGGQWRSGALNRYHFKLEFDGHGVELRLLEQSRHHEATAYLVAVSGTGLTDTEVEVTVFTQNKSTFTALFEINGVRESCCYTLMGKTLFVDDGTGHYRFDNITHRPAQAEGGVGSGLIKASMDGAIVDILVVDGESVKQGQTIVVLEAMKMEHQLKSAVDGVVESISATVGQQVKTKQLLATINNNVQA